MEEGVVEGGQREKEEDFGEEEEEEVEVVGYLVLVGVFGDAGG